MWTSASSYEIRSIRGSLQSASMQLNPAIFKAYDIRGTTPTTLNEAVAERLGLAFGQRALALGEHPGKEQQYGNRQHVLHEEVGGAACSLQPVIGDDQGAGQRGHDEDVAAPRVVSAPEKDDKDGHEVAAPEMGAGYGDVEQKEQQGQCTGKEQDEVGTGRTYTHMGVGQIW